MAAMLVLSAPAKAQPRELQRVEPLTLSLEVGAALALTAGALVLPTPQRCRWCTPPGLDESLAQPASEPHRRGVALLSHSFSMALVPALALSTVVLPPLATREPDVHSLENLAILGEAALLDEFVTTLVKKAVARQRPAFYYGRQGSGEYADSPKQENVSFFSGDTSVVFALSAAMSTLSFMRGYRSAPYVTAVSGLLASATAFLRVRADVHWASDVATGALVGTGVGIAVPLLLHPRAPDAPVASASAFSTTALGVESRGIQLVGQF